MPDRPRGAASGPVQTLPPGYPVGLRCTPASTPLGPAGPTSTSRRTPSKASSRPVRCSPKSWPSAATAQSTAPHALALVHFADNPQRRRKGDMQQALIMMALPKSRWRQLRSRIYLQLKNTSCVVAPFLSPILIGLCGWISIEISEGTLNKIIIWLGVPTISIYTILVHVLKESSEVRRIRRIKRCMHITGPPLLISQIKKWELCPRSGSQSSMFEQPEKECVVCKAKLDVSTGRIPDHLLSQEVIWYSESKLLGS